jgi:hypothetical protein
MDKNRTRKKKTVLTDNFLEKLRELGSDLGDSVTKDVIEGLPENAFDQVLGKQKSGELKPNQSLNLEERQEGEQFRRQLNREFFQIRQEERLVFKQEEQKTQLQIKALQEELKNLAVATKDLVQEVEKAAKIEPVDPGVYHLHFFEKLKQTIITLRKKIEDSANWLALFNQRSKKKNYYWSQVRKSGTKFMLSQERYMATQAG